MVTVHGACSRLGTAGTVSDESLSEVTGQDGITVLLTSPTELSADRIDWRTDSGGFDINNDSTIDATELALDATLGTAIIPSARVYSSITLTPQ